MAQQKSKFTDNWEDKRHSKVWEDRVASESKALNKQMNYVSEMQHRKNDPHYPDYYEDANEANLEHEYDGMLVQDFTDDAPYSRHSQYYYQRESEVVHELAE